MDTYETIVRAVCNDLRAFERVAIREGNWDLYYQLHGERMHLVRKHFPNLFFSPLFKVRQY